ncbi:methyltransferase domain-containing protein [Actinomadura sp. KC345]|nr:methyltransferase domain-containing protein [Actinomadura sp. KC345]
MKEEKGPLDRSTATEYAAWFKALADPTRIQIVSLLARQGRPMNVSEIVDNTEAIVERYSGLARFAMVGGTPEDGASCGDSCSGAAAHPGEDGVPEAALRASLGCGNPLAVADLRPGETVLDLGSGGGLDVLLSARRVGPDGTAYGLEASEAMLTLARANAAEAGLGNARFLQATSRTSRFPPRAWTWSSPTASSTSPPTRPACSPKPSASCVRADASGSATSSPTPASTPASASRRSGAWAVPRAPSLPRSTAATCSPRASPAPPSPGTTRPRPASTRRSCRPPDPPEPSAPSPDAPADGICIKLS